MGRAGSRCVMQLLTFVPELVTVPGADGTVVVVVGAADVVVVASVEVVVVASVEVVVVASVEVVVPPTDVVVVPPPTTGMVTSVVVGIAHVTAASTPAPAASVAVVVSWNALSVTLPDAGAVAMTVMS